MKNILVTGANGQLGRELNAIHKNYDYTFWFADRTQLDISDASVVAKIVSFNPDLIINCAAYTLVDLAEEQKTKAKDVNATSLKNIAAAAKMVNAPLLHISTDYVYDINKRGPLLESDGCSPKSVYASTKFEGEKIASKTWSQTCVIRTSWIYSSFGNNFVKTMLKLAESRNELSIVNDQIGAPTYAADLANTLMSLGQSILDDPDNETFYGVFNYSNEGTISWLDFAQEIFRYKNITMALHPLTTKEYGAKAPRPLWSVMSKSKIKNTFGIETPHWLDALHRCLDLL